MDVPNAPTVCRNCEGNLLSWFSSTKNCGTAQDGRIKMNEVQAIFVLGCDECSETMMIVPADEIAELMNLERT